MKIYNALLLLLMVALSCVEQKSTGETTPAVSEDGWTYLLTEDLTGWQQVGSVNSKMENGTLTLLAEEGSAQSLLVSEGEYDNFELELDFQTDESETGILFRFNDQLRTVPLKAGYMVSTDLNPDQQNPAGTILTTARATVPEGLTTGWNTMRVEASKTHLKVFLNDQLVAEANDERFDNGKLGIQAPKTGGKTSSFKNMRIRTLVTLPVVTELLEDRYRADESKPWEQLFDGETLQGWSPIGDGSWEVVEGAIHGYSGEEGGFLVSDKAYKDFYLKTKFKIIKEDNSGIFIRKSPDSAAVTITDAIECNIYDHNGPSHAYSTGSIATHARAWYGMIDYNEWNEMEIFAENEHIVMFVNGQKSSESYLPKTFDKAGNICLQGGIKVFAPDKGPSDVYFQEVQVKSFD